jgi:Flp pilus assembly protein TadB
VQQQSRGTEVETAVYPTSQARLLFPLCFLLFACCFCLLFLLFALHFALLIALLFAFCFLLFAFCFLLLTYKTRLGAFTNGCLPQICEKCADNKIYRY